MITSQNYFIFDYVYVIPKDVHVPNAVQWQFTPPETHGSKAQ